MIDGGVCRGNHNARGVAHFIVAGGLDCSPDPIHAVNQMPVRRDKRRAGATRLHVFAPDPLGYGSNHRGESRKRVGAALRFGALRNLTGDHRWSECPFRSSSHVPRVNTQETSCSMFSR
jgi:hypothetical protein